MSVNHLEIACHKLDPAGVAGARSAMHDAICLANWINVLPSLDVPVLGKTFQEYYLEQYPHALENYERSRLFASSNAKVKDKKFLPWSIHALFLVIPLPVKQI